MYDDERRVIDEMCDAPVRAGDIWQRGEGRSHGTQLIYKVISVDGEFCTMYVPHYNTTDTKAWVTMIYPKGEWVLIERDGRRVVR